MTIIHQVMLLINIPIVLIIFISVISQIIAFQYFTTVTEDIKNGIFNDRLAFLQTWNTIISMQLTSNLQKFPVYLNTMNSLYFKIFNSQVKINPKYQNALANVIQTAENTTPTNIYGLQSVNPLWVNSWYQQNTSDFTDLDATGQETLDSASLVAGLQGAIILSRNMEVTQLANNSLAFEYVLTVFQNEGFLFANYINNTMKSSQVSQVKCETTQFGYDPRCSIWYENAQREVSFWLNPPHLSDEFESSPFISQEACQKSLAYNNQTNQSELHHMLCFSLKEQAIFTFLKNITSTKTSDSDYYLIDPRSKILVYDSDQSSIDELSYFSSVQQKYFLNQSDQEVFDKKIDEFYNMWVYSAYDSLSLQQSQNFLNLNTTFTFTSKDQKFAVVLSPVIVLDKVQKYSQAQQQENYNILAEIAYLSINIISQDQNLSVASLKRSLYYTFVIVISIFACFGIFSVTVTLVYSYYIAKFFIITPVKHLTTILNEINSDIKSNDYYFIFSEGKNSSFLSQETKELYTSLQQIFQLLLYTQQHFFKDNEAESLLRLHKNIELFLSLKNFKALGITHNNIGNIHLNQHRFNEALEHFAASIMYAKYEIDDFCYHNSDFLYLNILKDYCFSDKCIPKFLSISIPKFSCAIFKQNTAYTKTMLNQTLTQCAPQSQGDNENFYFGNTITDQFSKVYSDGKKQSQCYEITQGDNAKTRTSIFKRKETKVDGNILVNSHQLQFELLMSLYYRKKNYANALIAFQENQSTILSNKPNLGCSSSSYSGYNPLHQYETNGINLWLEIKCLLKELHVIIKSLPIINYQEIIILLQIAKAHFMLQNHEKYEKAMNQSDALIKKYYQINPNSNNSNLNLNINNICSYNNSNNLDRVISDYQSINHSPSKMNLSQISIISQQSPNLSSFQPQPILQKYCLEDQLPKLNRNKAVSFRDNDGLTSPLSVQKIMKKQNSFQYHQQNQDINNSLKKNSLKFDSHPQRINSFNIISHHNHNNHRSSSGFVPTLQLKKEIISTSQNKSASKLQGYLSPLNRISLKEDWKVEQRDSFSSYYHDIQSSQQKPVLPFEQRENSQQLQKEIAPSENKEAVESQQLNINLSEKQKKVSISSKQQNDISGSKTDKQLDNVKESQQLNIEVKIVNDQNKNNGELKTKACPLIKGTTIQNILEQRDQGFSQQQEKGGVGEYQFLQNIFNSQFIPISVNQDNTELSNNSLQDSLPNLIQRRKTFRKKQFSQSGVENLFEFQRKMTSNYEEKSKLNIVIQEYLTMMIRFVKAEYLMYEGDFISAASILSDILEFHQTIISHYYFNIVQQISTAFNQLQIQSKDLNEIKKRFNKGISLEVTVIICQHKTDKLNLKQLNLVSNLIKQVLTSPSDMMGITLTDKDNCDVFQYMNLHKVSNFKGNAEDILEDIISFYQEGNKMLIRQQIEYRLDTSATVNYNLNELQQQTPYQYFTLNNNEGSYFNEKAFSFNNDSIKECTNAIDQSNNSQNIGYLDEHDFQQQQNHSLYLEDACSRSLQKSINPFCRTKKGSYQSREESFEQRFRIFGNRKRQYSQVKMNVGDISCFSYEETTSKEILDSQVNLKSKQSEENRIFHFSIRSAISSILVNNRQYQYTLLNQNLVVHHNNHPSSMSAFPEENHKTSQINDESIPNEFQFQKFIVYQTEQIFIEKNQLFNHLCTLLSTLKVQLIIVSKSKGSNFLEELEDLTLTQSEQEIIKIFYSYSKLISYLKNKRDPFTKYTYTSFIQSY